MSKKITFNCIWFQQFKQIPHYKKKCCYLIIYFMNLQRSHNANVKDCSPTVKTNMQVNLLDVIPAGRQNRKQMSERDGITCTGRGNEWTRVEECDRGRQFLLAGSGLSVPASLRRSDIHQVCLSVLDSGSTEGPFKIRPLLPLAQLQIKAHSEGDSYAHRPPLGNGWDGPMSAFVEGESRAERSRRQTDREELNTEWRGKKRRKMQTQNTKHFQAARHKLDRGSCRDLLDICSMSPIYVCVPFSPGTLTGTRNVIKSCSYAFGVLWKYLRTCDQVFNNFDHFLLIVRLLSHLYFRSLGQNKRNTIIKCSCFYFVLCSHLLIIN